MDINIQEQYEFLFKPKRYKCLFSGRGAGKSVAVAQFLLIIGSVSKRRVLCCRELQLSIADSSKKLLEDLNDKYNLGYAVTNHNMYHPITKSEFIFYGIKTNTTKLKSLEGVDYCWVEEAENITEDSLDILIPTIRKSGSEIIFTFNPSSENDAIYKMFVKPNVKSFNETGGLFEDDDQYVMMTGYWDNIYLPEPLQLEIAKLKRTNYNKYLHIYRGDVNVKLSDLFNIAMFQTYTELPQADYYLIACDTAFDDKDIADPSAFVVGLVSGKRIYIVEVFTKRMKYPELKKQLKTIAAKYPTADILIESAASGQALIPDLKLDSNYNIIPMKTGGKSKVTRASNVVGTVEAGNVFLPAEADWLDDFLYEVGRFPMVKHDDRVDAFVYLLTHVRDRHLYKEPEAIFTIPSTYAPSTW